MVDVPPPDTRLTRLLLGPALPTSADRHERLSNPEALAILSSDALSSVAYATEEMVKVLLPVAGIAAFALSVPLSGVVILLLVTLIVSYRQTIRAYPNAGGAYIVTRDNFGLVPAQVAGVALLTDYITSVAVSISAGVAAMYSQFPALFAYRVPISVAFIWLITCGNLRGIRMTGRLFATPTYLFLLAVSALLAVGGLRALTGGLHPLPPPGGIVLPPETTAVGVLVVLHAYASGTTALTGVEAISNGVTAFRPPEASNAVRVLMWMGAILAASFAGITLLAWRVHPIPTAKKTLVSELGGAIFGNGSIGRSGQLALQITTTGILVLAANTSYSDFPRLASFHAGDGYLPRPLRRRGRRLVFSTGILTLAGASTMIVVALGASVHRLIPLYAVGVFASFTFSQAGMSIRHWRRREEHWRRGLAINATGAVGSGFALVVVAVAKFERGAWVVILLVPVVATVFVAIHRHYERTDRRLADLDAPEQRVDAVVVVARRGGATDAARRWAAAVQPGNVALLSPRRLARRLPDPRHPGDRVLVAGAGHRLRRRLARRPGVAFVSLSRPGWEDVSAARHAVLVVAGETVGLSRRAVALARALAPADLHAAYVELDPERTAAIVDGWHRLGAGVALEVLPSPYREPGGPVAAKVRALHEDGADVVSVVMADVVPRWWQRPLYSSDARVVRAAVASVPRTVVVEDPVPL
ncbi:MAG: putative integral rane protein [Acidimicrobiales bacterium]|nr:putative integral rane protein [Acidimicrobiales bacterium]